MRPFKVRGYAVEEYANGQWMYGTGIHVTDFTDEYAKETGKKEECFIFTESGWVEVIKESVGQYTGLKFNGITEIYEGHLVEFDIFQNGNKETGVVKSFDGSYIVEGVYEYTCDGTRHCNTNKFHLGKMVRNNKITNIIGNIYEDKHLLGVQA